MAVHIIPISELRQKLKQILAKIESTGEPYFVTQYSRPRAVLVRYQDYNTLMEQAAGGHAHIERRPGVSGGEPVIKGTRISVRHIVERTQSGETLDDILAALPHVTAAQVYDALSYYHDHQSEIDQLIAESRPEQVMAAQGLRAERLAEGIAIVHKESGQ